MTSEKSYANEQRLNALIGNATNWASMGAMSSGWSVGTSAKYRLTMDGLLVLAWRNLNVGTFNDGTTLWSAANGLPSGFRPASTNLVITAATDHMSNPSSNGSESAAVGLFTDGSVTIFGLNASSTRLDVCGVFPIDN